MLSITTETDDDWYEVEALYDLCFAPGRSALSSYRLREGVAPVAALSRVARDDYGSVAGAIRYWPVRIGDSGAPALLLGPVAVHPTHQGEGLGGGLIRESLSGAGALGWQRVLLVGDEPYYGRFGFSRAAARSLDFPPPTNPDRLLARGLVDGAFDDVAGLVRGWGDGPVAPQG
ncbi:GNAT family N-acetyltransferase [Oceanomicrobium pacificus]|uniref:GNAT family N-acetyltransferase n=1 Tax=Oceanomicrobium pacificus TaxID=2692916 RepID=A0A6B0U0V0_9RHOB|nr:N-acetyltransferase [Oceanomicrobium pacificus]MXU66863.1 GNAT family N-acetyltransferase [Oceanomicrobium pacificus]